jgi:hypothetical protein
MINILITYTILAWVVLISCTDTVNNNIGLLIAVYIVYGVLVLALIVQIINVLCIN